MLLKNKDLTVILDSFLRAMRQRGTGEVPRIAFVMSPEGKLAQFSGQLGRPNVRVADEIRYLENGILTLVREGKCKAIGPPFAISGAATAQTTVEVIAGIFLEHQDTSAFRIEVAALGRAPANVSVNRIAPVMAEPRFFLRSRFAHAR